MASILLIPWFLKDILHMKCRLAWSDKTKPINQCTSVDDKNCQDMHVIGNIYSSFWPALLEVCDSTQTEFLAYHQEQDSFVYFLGTRQ